MSTLTAGAPAPVLLDRLETAGFGDLAGADLRGVRATLAALVRILPSKQAHGLATAEQIATKAGYSPRWVRRCLHFLEDLGLVEWQRGGVAGGQPQPSWFRIDKRELLALVLIARNSRDQALAKLRLETAARIEGLRRLYVRSKSRKNRRSVHAELSSSPLSIEEVPGPDPGPPVPRETRERIIAGVRSELAARRDKEATHGPVGQR